MIIFLKYRGTTPGQIASAFVVGLFVLHCWSAYVTHNPRMFVMHGIAFLYDIFLLAISVIVLQLLSSHLVPKRRWFKSFAKLLIIVTGLTLASYPLILAVFFGFPVNIFAVDLAVTSFFLSMVLGSSGLLAMLFVGLIAALSIYFRLPSMMPSKTVPFWGLVFLSMTGIVLSLYKMPFMSPHPHPLIYSMQETAKSWFTGTRRVVPRLTQPVASSRAITTKLSPSSLTAASFFQYDHVIFLVMETVDEPRFSSKFISRKDGFFAAVKDRSAFFNNYYTTNLDSYTSLITMLTSIQVPYRAYDRPKTFAGVNKAPSLVSALQKKGWKSLFVCTGEYMPFIPVKKYWSKMLVGRDLSHKDKWVSVGLNAIEAATEDKIAVPHILSWLKSYPRTLVMHEMVFGHSPRWKVLTGKGQLEYYDEFFQSLYKGLQEEGLEDKTLIVIVADHGDRTDAALVKNYHVPLLVVGRHIKKPVQTGMFSHEDLQQIVGYYLSNLPLPTPREDVLVVGHTGRWVYGRITNDGRHHFIDALDGVLLTPKGKLSPQDTFERFQAGIDSFARFQQQN